MDDLEINALFEQVCDNSKDQPEAVKHIFSVLLSSTLAFRDRIQKEKDIIVTVEDVTTALDWLFEFMQSQKMPDTNNSTQISLFNCWLGELNKFI
ncbi:Uncharacterized protein dnl_39100 [Desulfonema limicola]|uniref:Uncharacterized protein n=1 Tax=Desulfonema limicola TaxID=45656 RepID=A0A975BA97_9BACT|nr:hypothetical protein [Desulfonema limicola]QTA81572.1 Uncharacterized protein dnl_39100 [Desulfonema limicola]